MDRIKNARILGGLLFFLIFVKLIPVACIFKSVTGISCPSCGMTRSFNHILHFEFLEAAYQNLLGIPLFIVLAFCIIMLIRDIIKNRFRFIPHFLNFLLHYIPMFVLLLIISFIFNNIKP